MLPIFIIFLSNHCGGLVLSYTYRWEYAFSCLVLHTDGSTHLVFSYTRQTIISQTCYGLHLLHLFQEAGTKTLLYALLYGPESLQRAGVLPIIIISLSNRCQRLGLLPIVFITSSGPGPD